MSTPKASFFRRYLTAIIIVILLLVVGAAQFLSWPYVIYGPGSAEPVHPRVETGHKLDEKGSILFTTVSTYSKPSALSLAYAWLNPRMDIHTEQEATGGTTNMAAYRNLLSWMRDSSEATAMLAAYGAMDRKINVEQKGVIVVNFLKESKADDNGLQEGDIITSVDGKATLKAEDLVAALSSRKPGDKVQLAGTRGGKPFKVTVPLIEMPDTHRPGIGFQNNSVIKVTPPDPVKFDFNDVGGPSAGLMMTIEIVAQLTGEDLSRGYRIAGTGTIDADGQVGLIGGIQYKLMAADKENVDYFLVPYTQYGIENWKNGQSPSQTVTSIHSVVQGFDNWNTAERTVKDLKLKPKLVPVSSLKDALAFLRSLPPKK